MPTDVPNEPRRWRVKARVLFPTEVVPTEPGSLRKGLEQHPRVPSETHDFDGVTVRVAPIEPDGKPAPWESSWGEIMLEVVVGSREAAIEATTEPLERALETLSFQLQTALHVESFLVVDAHAEDAGEPAQAIQLTGLGTSAFPLRRFRTVPHELGGDVTLQTPELSFSLSALDAEQRLALDWCLKALASQFEMDRFLFLWIAMECLWRRSVSLKTAREGRKGQKIRAFLRKSFGVDDQTAKAMWTARQVVHGESAFTPTVADDLETFSRHLRIGINAHIKDALGLRASDPPLIVQPALSIASIGLVMGPDPNADSSPAG
jgi:hypothetical protein